ncbi:MAG TPA: hypothetical protein VGB03_07680 [Acidimicrobiales bacterium]|jgi:hypothetical protein
MRRPIIAGVVLGVALAASPLAGHAATSPSLTLLTPAGGDTVTGTTSVTWSYVGLSNTTPVDVEVSTDGTTFTRVLRTVADNGTPGYFGSASWNTTGTADGAGYTVRIVMPTRRSVTSSASPVTVDNTGPTTAFDDPAADGAPQVAVLDDVEGTASDALSAVASVAVTFVDDDGNETPADVTCTCGTSEATWAASTDGLAPGQYEVQAVATDAYGNVGAATSESFVVVGMPTPPDPTVVTGPVVAAIEGVIATLPTVEEVQTAVEEAVATVPVPDVEEVKATVDEIVATLPTLEEVQTAVEEAIAGLPVPNAEAVKATVDAIVATLPDPTTVPTLVQETIEGIGQ